MDSRPGLVIDKLLVACSILYVTLPIVFFFCGWLNYYLAVLLSIIFIFCACTLYAEFSPVSMINRETAKFWLIVVVCLALWVFMSGIGGVVYQNTDFTARNAFYRDLCNYDWPVIYDNSAQSETVRKFIGDGKTLLSYYFSWWLFPAFISKVFELGEPARDFLLYSWAFLGVFLTTYNLCRYFKKTSYIIPLIFIFFSGLDLIGALVSQKSIFRVIERWTEYFIYTSNTINLFCVFNQSIPVYIIMSLLLQLKDSKNQLAIASLSFAYSPWAAIGIIPIALTAAFIYNKNIRKIFSAQNILIPLAMLVVYGAFYLTGNASSTYHGGFTLTGKIEVYQYILFILLEFGVYFLIMGKAATEYKYYYVILIELMLIPCYKVLTEDFIMRASFPALFILMTFLMKIFLDGKKGIRRRVLIAAIFIGAWTPMGEINKAIGFTSIDILRRHGLLPASIQSMTFEGKSMVRGLRHEEIYSLGSIRTTEEEMITGYRDHFLAYNYEDSFFFKYLAK